ncbi:MAG: hypothetical protein V1487_01280 [bacterium]
MAGSRLNKVRSRRAGKQGVAYLVIAILLIVGMIGWGLPMAARLAGLLVKSGNDPRDVEELRPTAPIFSDVPEATYSAQVQISGFAQPGLEVILYLNSAEYERKLTSESGTFIFENIGITEGVNTVYAYSATTRELRSEQSKSYLITLDTVKPVVTIDSPKDGEVFRGTTARIANFAGSVNELGSKVYIGERMVIVQADGKFNLPYQLVEGDQELPIRTIDKAGNENVTSIKLRWEP